MGLDWTFGEYLQRLLDKRHWKMTDLAKATGISYTYIRWLVTGEASGKNGPPKPTLDTIFSLSSAFGVHYTKLIAAYKGIDPDTLTKDASDEDIKRAVEKALRLVEEERKDKRSL